MKKKVKALIERQPIDGFVLVRESVLMAGNRTNAQVKNDFVATLHFNIEEIKERCEQGAVNFDAVYQEIEVEVNEYEIIEVNKS